MLLNLAKFLQPIVKTLYCDIPSFLSPEIVTGTAARPDLLVVDRLSNLFIIELTVGHESNTVANATRKAKKYEHLLNDSDLKRSHRKICFVNLVMTAIGIYSKHSEEIFKMLKDLNIDNNAATYISTKLTEICIRSSYYILCMRTKEWTELNLMNF